MHRGPVHVGNPPVGSPDWHAARADTINGSEIAAVLGISPYDSPFSLFHRKAGRLDEVAQTDEMYWGTALEAVIRDEFARRRTNDLIVRDGGGLWRHPDRDWQGGSPDGQIFTPEQAAPVALLECKTARYDDGWGDEGTDEIPVHYRAQVLWYLDVFDLELCYVAVLIAGSEYREYQVRRDDTELGQMRAAAEAFLHQLRAGTPPDIDGHDATYQAVKDMHPDIEPASVLIDDDIAETYLRALAAEKDAKAEKTRASALIADAMGTARDAYYRGVQIASRQVKTAPGSIPYVVAARGMADRYRQEHAA